MLVLRKSPPPDVPYDPNAASRVEQKFAAADQAKAAGQPAQVQLDRTELNSYLQQNLECPGSPQPAAPDRRPPQPQEARPLPEFRPTPTPVPWPRSPAGTAATLEQVQSSVKDVKVDMEGDLVKAYVFSISTGRICRSNSTAILARKTAT